VLLDKLHCLAAIRRFQKGGFALHLHQHVAQCLANQGVIVDQKDFHRAAVPSDSAASKNFGPRNKVP
jgi:hypothetical protein